MSETYTSFSALKLAHDALLRERAKGESAPDSAWSSAIEDFLSRARVAGAYIERPSERLSAQHILEFWTAELLSFGVVDANSYSTPILAPYQPSLAQNPAAPSVKADSSEFRDSREAIRFSALARQWRASDGAAGYLLSGKALEEAERHVKADPSIEALVAASKVAARGQFRLRLAVASTFVLTLLFAGILGWLYDQADEDERFGNLETEEAGRYADLLTAQTQSQLQQARAAAEAQQAQIDRYARLLAENGISLDDNAAAESVSTNVAETIRIEGPMSGGQVGLHQDGFIWIGSESADKSNLADPSTGTAVLPADVVPNQTYRVTKNLVFRSAAPEREHYTSALGIGVLPAGTQVTALAVPEEPYERPSGAQYWLSARVERSEVPIVYLQYAGSSPQEAEEFAAALRDQGYQIPGIQATDLADDLNEVRFYFAEDSASAERLAGDTTEILSKSNSTNRPSVAKDQTALKGPGNYPGVIELWLDLPPSAE